MSLPQIINLANLLFLALAINIPLGCLRAEAKKKSFTWFLWIHASIPFIIVLRQEAGFDWRIIPATLTCAVLGQLIGGTWLSGTTKKQ